MRLLVFLGGCSIFVLCGCPTEAEPLTAKSSPTMPQLADSGVSGSTDSGTTPPAFLGDRETVCGSPIAPLAAEHGGRCSTETYNCILNCSVSGFDFECHRYCAEADITPADGTVNGEPYDCDACLRAAFFPCLGANGCETQRSARDCCLEQNGCENWSCDPNDPCAQLGMTLQACAENTAYWCFDYSAPAYGVCFQ